MNMALGVESEANEKINVRDLKFFYGDNLALKGINVALLANRVTAFIGPSGCGKSTLLRVFNRMYELYPNQRAEGEVLLDGKNILDADEDLNLLRSRVGMVFQKPTPFPMTIYENIAFGIRLYENIPKSEMDGRVEKALRGAALWNEVSGKLNASGLSLSGGQQQRLCIARTVAIHPDVILLDEPCSALDPISTAKVEDLIGELSDSYTIAIVTHNMQQAARVSQFTAFMYLGELVEFGETNRSSPPQTISARRTTSPADSAEGARPVVDHTVRAYDKELSALERRIAEMGGIAEKMVIDAMDALAGATPGSRNRSSPPTPDSTPCSAMSRSRRSSPSPDGNRWRWTCVKSSARSASPAISNASATLPRTSPSARSGSGSKRAYRGRSSASSI